MAQKSKTDQLREMREARVARPKLNPFEDAARGRDPGKPVPTLKPGRPKIAGPRAWEAEGMSRRTWYRRKATKREATE